MKKTPQHKGFTLVELSVVMVIIALIVGGGLKITTKVDHKNRVRITHERMQLIVNAINQRAKLRGYLQCPANPQAPHSAGGDFGFGDESASNCNATNVTGHASYPTGTVPTRALAIPPGWAIDGWGNRITYIVDEALVVKGDGTNPTNGTAGTGYTASDAAGTIDIHINANGTASRTDIAVILISHGANKFGAWPAVGGPRFNATGGSTLEDENTDADGVFVMGLSNPDLDDIVYTITKWQLDGDWP